MIDVLSVIRSASLPVHKQLDGQGIGKHLRANSITTDIYADWLASNHGMFASFYALVEAGNGKFIDRFLIDRNALAYIEMDLLELGYSHLKKNYIFQTISHFDLCIVPVYTMLGSLMGTAMIDKHIKENHPNFPRNYLSFVMKQPSQWREFLTFIQSYQLSISEAELSSYTKTMWLALLEE